MNGTARHREIAKLLRALCPAMPLADFTPVVETACERRFKTLPPSIALWQALGAHIRHRHTDYNELLDDGYDRDAARYFVVDAMNEILARWGCARRIESGPGGED